MSWNYQWIPFTPGLNSMIVLAWIQGNPCRLKVYVGNRVAQILDLTPSDTWNHVTTEDNPADCASGGTFPSELLSHDLWWNGPHWRKLPASKWCKINNSQPSNITEDVGELRPITCNIVILKDSLIPFHKFSSFNHYRRITAWVTQFLCNCRAKT